MDNLFSLEGKNRRRRRRSRGMGHGIAEGLAKYGANLAIADINAAALEQAAKDSANRRARRSATYNLSTAPTRAASRRSSPALSPTWAGASMFS